MARTVRRGWSLLLAVGLGIGVPACGGDGEGDEGPPTTGEPTAATLPDDVEAGAGLLVLDGTAYALTVRACTLEPVTDPATGVTTDLAIDADDSLGVAVSLTRATTPGAVPTVTDTITVVPPDGLLVEANRADTGGRFIDLLAEGALTPLLTVDGDVVTGAGVLGAEGARPGDPGLVEGSVIVRCPPAG